MISKFVRGFLNDEDGASTILCIFWFILFVGLGGLAVDVTDAFRTQTMMQATADASAHAGVIDLPDPATGTATAANEAAAVATALAYAEANMPAASYGVVLSTSDVEIGVWAPIGRTFTPDAKPANAVRVTLRSTAATGNSLPTNFLRIIGLQEWNITVTATAAYSVSGDCFDYYGFLARGFIDSGSENDYYGVCMHGEKYVKVGSQNNFYDDTQVSMYDLDLLLEGVDNLDLHPEFPEGSLLEGSYDPSLVDLVPSVIDGLASGDVTPPVFLANPDNPKHVVQLPSTLEEGSLYVVYGSNDVVIQSDAVVQNIGVVVTDPSAKLLVGSNVSLSNVLLAAQNNVEVGSLNQIGNTDFCNTGQGAVFIFTKGDYKAGSQTDYTGVQIVSVGDSYIGSELTSAGKGPEALSVQAGGNIYWGSQEIFRSSSCQAPSFFALDGRVAIVD